MVQHRCVSDSDGTPPHAIVDAIRVPFLESLDSEWRAGRSQNALVMLRERGVSKDLIRERYSGRYPFELLQNADDASSERGPVGRARFELTDTALLVADDGAGFAEPNIRAICTLGDSSKDSATSIGYKGLGFKSVGEITERPQIVSSGAWFEFNAARARAEITGVVGPLEDEFPLPTYALPFPIVSADLVPDAPAVQRLLDDEYRTVLRLPLRDGITRDEVATHVAATVRPSLLLFLRSTETIVVRGTEHDFEASVLTQPDGDVQRALLTVDGEVSEWLIFSGRAVDFANNGDDAAPESSITDPAVSVAVPILDDKPDITQTYSLHVYFPTDERTGYPWLANADWELHLDRRQLSDTPEGLRYNTWLTRRFARFVTEIVVPSLDRRLGAGAALQAVTPRGPASGFGETLQTTLTDRLLTTPVIPLRGGRTAEPGAARLLPGAVSDPIDALDLCRPDALLDIPDAVTIADPAVRDYLANSLRVPVIAGTEFLGALREPTMETAERYYRFLLDVDSRVGRTAFVQRLRDVPSVLTDNGVMRPSERPFLPREATGAELPPGLQVPIARLPDLPGLEDLMKQAGVQEFRWREVVLTFLVPLLEQSETTAEQRERALDAMRLYLASQRGGDQQVREAAGRTLLPCRSIDGTTPGLRPASELYFPSEWADSDSAEGLYGPFGQPDFLAVEPPPDAEHRDNVRDLYAFLGVADSPRINAARTTNRDTWMLRNLANHPHRADPGWDSWWAEIQRLGATDCTQEHGIGNQQLRISARLDRFDDLVACGDMRRLRILWDELAKGWTTGYAAATEALVHCQHRWHYSNDKDRQFPSLLMHGLRSAAWVPAVVANESRAATPAEVWRAAPGTPKAVAEVVPILRGDLQRGHARAMAEDLGITDAARPRPHDLIALLGSLADQAERPDAAQEVSVGLATAARWALARLNEALPGGPAPPPDRSVRLLARQDGRLRFVESPVVARDPLLRETFADRLPILNAESDLSEVNRYFRLDILDDKVDKMPRPVGRREDLEPTIGRRFEDAKPWLYALVSADRPSATGTAHGRLTRLDFLVRDELMLVYQYDDHLVPRPEAVAHIAERSEELAGAVTRTSGTAYLEIDAETGQPHWYAFGPLLARYLQTPTLGDAFGMLLAADNDDRHRMMTARRIDASNISAARHALGQRPRRRDR
jgi:hypothetical protein